MEVAQNIFDKGLQQDISSLRVPPGYMVDSYQVEITNKEGSNFAVTAANGNELHFSLSAGFIPMAIKEYSGLLYICSINTATSQLELGTFRSPSATPNEAGVSPQNVYAPLQNLNGSAMTLDYSDLEIIEDPEYIDLVLQYDYDDSINMIIVSKQFQPFLINTGFKFLRDKFYSTVREDYQSADLLDQLKLIIDASDTLDIEFQGITSGGQLKPGAYRYYFSYLTQDLNESELVGQSSNCQVFFGSGDKIRGGDSTEITSSRATLALSNVDTTFKYLQVYFTYVGGDNVRDKQILKFARPIAITGETQIFVHSGIEEVDEISSEDLAIDFANIKSAATADSAKGFLFLGDIEERERLNTVVESFAATIELGYTTTSFSETDLLYRDSINIHDSLGYFGGEAYAFGLVVKYKGGGYSPVFPVKGWDFVDSISTLEDGKETGVLRFPTIEQEPFFDGNYKVRALTIETRGTISEELQETVSEMFIVRAERQNSNLIAQGVAMPTINMPPGEFIDPDPVYYWDKQGPDYSRYKWMPSLDGLIECWKTNFGSNQFYVVNNDNVVNGTYMIYATNQQQGNNADGPVQMYNRDKLAFYSPDLYANPTTLGSGVGSTTIAKVFALVKTLVKDEIEPNTIGVATVTENYFAPINTLPLLMGTRYDFDSLIVSNAERNVTEAVFVPEGTYATGSDFISKMHTQFYWGGYSFGGDGVESKGHMSFLPFVGLQLENDLGGINNSQEPAGVKARIQKIEPDYYNGHNGRRSLSLYPNLNTEVNIGHLLNLYAGELGTAVGYYPNRDSIQFSQIGKRYKPNNMPTSLTLYGGDCFLGKTYQRVSQSPYRDPLDPAEDKRNHPQGLIFSYVAESAYNPNLRHRYFENSSDLERLTFYPYEKDYRDQRYKDSSVISEGYKDQTSDFGQIPNPNILPDVKSSFYTRIFPSSFHVPNSFENGYRIFTTGFKDYPTQYGRLNRVVGYGPDVLMVFDHGIGITPIQPRTQTAEDVAGAVYITSENVLTEAFGPLSNRYGSQHQLAVYKTPHHVYGMDAEAGKFWKVGGEGRFNLISDGYISSEIQTMTNPRVGYDPKNKLVYFTADEFAYIYSEELGIFTSRTATDGEFYCELAELGLIGFLGADAYLYQVTDQIYGNSFESFMEFTVNPNVHMTKVFDFINVISNNVRPKQIKLTAYNFDDTINQEAVIDAGVDFYTQEEKIFYRDKRFVAQVPKVANASYKELEGWGTGNRLRDKYVVVRVTYDSIDFETTAMQTFYRISRS